MKKLALLLAIAMVIGSIPGYALNATVDGFIENRKKSDILVVQDAGMLLDVTNRGIDKTYKTVTKPMDPILNPVRDVRDMTMKSSKKIVNKTWDMLTYFSPHREHRPKK